MRIYILWGMILCCWTLSCSGAYICLLYFWPFAIMLKYFSLPWPFFPSVHTGLKMKKGKGMMNVMPKRKWFHFTKLVEAYQIYWKLQPTKIIPLNQLWVVLSSMTSYRSEAVECLQPKAEWRFTRRFEVCLQQGNNKSGKCIKRGYDPKYSLYSAVFLSLANLQNLQSAQAHLL